MKKICLIIHSLGVGGMERVMYQLAIAFSARRNVEVHLILIGRKREIIYDIPKSIIIHRPDFEFKNSRRLFHTIRTALFLRRVVQRTKFKTILSFGEIWNNLVLLSLIGCNSPIYIADRSQPGKNLGILHNFLRNQLYGRAAGYIAQTEEAKRVCLEHKWNNNVKVIGNPIRKIDAGGPVEKENIVLSVGRLIKTKHFDQLIQMFADIDNPDWRLVIVGGDAKKLSLSKGLKKLIKKLGAEKSIRLEGEQKDVDDFYRKSKIFAFTSSSEGFPNVIGEAMSSGLPVVSYDCKAGPADLISDSEDGYLVPLFDQDMFKEKLKLLMKDDDSRIKMGCQARKKVQEFSVARIAEQFFNFISDNETPNQYS